MPKDQYLLLRALDEALVSLTELREGPARIASLQKQASSNSHLNAGHRLACLHDGNPPQQLA